MHNKFLNTKDTGAQTFRHCLVLVLALKVLILAVKNGGAHNGENGKKSRKQLGPK